MNNLHNVPLSQLADRLRVATDRELYAFMSLIASKIVDFTQPDYDAEADHEKLKADPFWSLANTESERRHRIATSSPNYVSETWMQS